MIVYHVGILTKRNVLNNAMISLWSMGFPTLGKSTSSLYWIYGLEIMKWKWMTLLATELAWLISPRIATPSKSLVVFNKTRQLMAMLIEIQLANSLLGDGTGK